MGMVYLSGHGLVTSTCGELAKVVFDAEKNNAAMVAVKSERQQRWGNENCVHPRGW